MTYAKRNRTSVKDIGYALYLYFLGLSYREVHQKHYPDLSEGVMSLRLEMGSTLQTRKNIFQKKENISKFIIDETQIKVGQDYFWIWVAIEPIDKVILGTYISLERNMQGICLSQKNFCIL